MSRRARIGLVLAGIMIVASALHPGSQVRAADDRPSVENLLTTSSSAFTWISGQTNIIQLEGSVSIQMEHRRLSADSAVIWLTPHPGALLSEQDVQIALLGHTLMTQDDVKRSGPYLLVNALVRGDVRVTAETRLERDRSDSDLYRKAQGLRAGKTPTTAGIHIAPTSSPSSRPATAPTKALKPEGGQWQHLETTKTSDGKIAFILSGGVSLIYRDAKDTLEFQGDTAVLFTSLTSLKDAQSSHLKPQEAAQAIYLEGDAQITFNSNALAAKGGEQRLQARRVYYELSDDRAILSDAILHTVDPKTTMPILVRADTIHQLARDEFDTEHVQLTTSQFLTPSLSVAADKAYVHRVPSVDTDEPTVTQFEADDVTLNLFNVPFFYFPSVTGEMPSNVIPLRDISFGSSSRFGPTFRSEWGIFESLGLVRPRNLDATYRVDYYGDRGPAGGLNADYAGGFVTDESRDPVSFLGSFRSSFVDDHGMDEFGGSRPEVKPPEQTRGRVLWSHQQFLPDDWQIQLHGGYFSDATYVEEWNQSDWYSNQPYNLSANIKHQHDTEAMTFAAVYQPNKSISSVDQVQEQFDIDRMPEVGYHRIGDNLGDTNLTFFSDNTASALRFRPAHADLVNQGFQYPDATGGMGKRTSFDTFLQNQIGQPSTGFVGDHFDPHVPDTTTYRGDMREELDFPFSAGQFRVVPYVLGRYIPYSDSISQYRPQNNQILGGGPAENRFYTGTGVRLTTAFWAVDDSVHSDLFDLNRLRHVVEPQVHLFTSAQTTDRNKLFIYDEDVDAINDVSAAQIALRQRWQTQRGGPGRWRSVDFLTLNVEADLFANKPPDNELRPRGFRGLFFDSLPEASIPRDSINADGTWRISDTTVMLSDASFNTDKNQLAIASTGVAVRRDTHISYFVGDRYIHELNSNIVTTALAYELSHKYTVVLSQSFDLGISQSVGSTLAVVRKFDSFFMVVSVFYDGREKDSGVAFSVIPNGFAAGVGNQALQSVFAPQP